MRVVPTVELHSSNERAPQQGIGEPEDCYAPFPTRADFEQAELFVNNNCSDRLINAQLTLARQNGMRLEMKTAREMHKLLACGAGVDADDSQVRPVHFTKKTSCLS